MRRKRAALAGGKPLEIDRTDGDAAERHDLVAELRQHPADLALLALGQDQLELRRVSLTPHDPGPGGADLAVGEPDAACQPGQGLGGGHARDERAIKFLDSITGVSQPVGQIAVVGQDHQTSAVFIQTADRVEPLGQLGKEVNHARAAGGVDVGRDVALGLVDRVVHGRFEADRLTVDRDPGLGGINPGAELIGNLTVDGNPALEDELLTRATRAQAGVGQDFLEALELAGLDGVGRRLPGR
jgi:hypothetical protein